MRLVRAELLKLSTTRLLLWLALLVLALLGLIVSLNGANRSEFDLARSSSQRDLLTVAAVSVLMSLILGIVASTAEYAHGTITQTFLFAPVRERVVAAKLVAVMLAALALALLAEAASLGLTALWLSIRSVPSQLGSRGTLAPLLGILIASALAAAIGVGLGSLIRRQAAAIVVALVWLFVAEPLIGISGKQRYEPGRAIASVVETGYQSRDLLDFWPGLLLSAGYAALFVVAGTVLVSRSDVT